jgi:hypothetical protein
MLRLAATRLQLRVHRPGAEDPKEAYREYTSLITKEHPNKMAFMSVF